MTDDGNNEEETFDKLHIPILEITKYSFCFHDFFENFDFG